MSAEVDHLIVGGGPAAVACAQRLRELDSSTSILVASRELDPPYDRTLCSKSYLSGERSRESALLRAADWWTEQDIELHTGTGVAALDLGAGVAKLANRDELSFGTALLATGANVRRLPVDGAELEGIHYLRALGNADAIRRDVEDAEDVVLVGGSYIGCEVAATLTTMGKRCTVLMREGTCLEHHIGAGGGRWIEGLLEERGIRFVAGDELERFEGDGKRVTRVVTCAGLRLDADAVVVGVGASPDVRLARSAGIELGASGGVRCDARLRSSASNVFAAGDMCEWDSPAHGGPARVEHWDVAAGQGAVAAANMLGGEEDYAAVPTFWSDLADWATLRFAGVPTGGERIVRGSLDAGAFSLWFLDGELVRGVLSVDRDEELDAAVGLVGARVAPMELADAGVDLAGLRVPALT